MFYLRRRPKISQSVPPFSSLYEDLAQCVLNPTPDLLANYHIPNEFYEFFSTLDAYDNQTGSTPNIDENLWKIMVNARRKKIESEFKVWKYFLGSIILDFLIFYF